RRKGSPETVDLKGSLTHLTKCPIHSIHSWYCTRGRVKEAQEPLL
ncbi:hypothetical protein Pmani_025782, partial [Petrolisthes manimaculis]